MPEEKKQRLKEYQKNYGEAKKSQYNNKKNNFFNCTFNSVCCDLVIHIVINEIVFLIII